MRIMQRACCGGRRGHIRLRSAAGGPKSMVETDFGRWSAVAVGLYAPPVGLPSGSARRLPSADREGWRSTFLAVAGGGLWLLVARDEWGAAGALLWIDVA